METTKKTLACYDYKEIKQFFIAKIAEYLSKDEEHLSEDEHDIYCAMDKFNCDSHALWHLWVDFFDVQNNAVCHADIRHGIRNVKNIIKEDRNLSHINHLAFLELLRSLLAEVITHPKDDKDIDYDESGLIYVYYYW